MSLSSGGPLRERVFCDGGRNGSRSAEEVVKRVAFVVELAPPMSRREGIGRWDGAESVVHRGMFWYDLWAVVIQEYIGGGVAT